MMNLNDLQNAINDYLTNCGQNPDGWDVLGAAIQLNDEYPSAESIDDIDPDDFTNALETWAWDALAGAELPEVVR